MKALALILLCFLPVCVSAGDVVSIYGNASLVGNLSIVAPSSIPSISSQPSSVTCITNTTVSFSVTASGTEPLSYQWQSNSVNIANVTGYSGATSSTLWVSNTTIVQSNLAFRCIVTNIFGSITSSVATLTVTNGTGGGGGGIALTNAANLVAFWKLGESSGSRIDSSTQGNDLSDHGSVTSAAGKIGNAAVMTGSPQYLSHVDSASLSGGNISMTIWCWIKWDGTGSRRFFLGKSDSSATVVDYGLEYNASADRYIFYWDYPQTGSSITANTHGSPAPDAGIWTLITCWHNAGDNTIHIKVNNEADDSSPYTGGVDGSGGFALGRLGDLDAFYADTDIDAVGISKVAPDASELSWIWNGGSGQEMP